MQPNKQYSVDWFSKNITKFQKIFQQFILNRKNNNIHFLEIGSFEGRSSCWFFENYIFNSANSTITCVDTWEGSEEHDSSVKQKLYERFLNNVSEYPKNKFLIKRGLSRVVLKSLPENYYDFIYIDGSHSTRDVLEDAVLSFDLLKSGGIITFDDYEWNHFSDPLLNPKLGIDSFITSYKNYIELIEESYQLTIIKK